MRVEIYQGAKNEFVGRITLEDGKAVFDEGASQYEDLFVYSEGRRVTPEDGETYMRAFPQLFRSPYIWAYVIED